MGTWEIFWSILLCQTLLLVVHIRRVWEIDPKKSVINNITSIYDLKIENDGYIDDINHYHFDVITI